MKKESMHHCFFIFLREAADWKQGRISGGWLGDGRGGSQFQGLGCTSARKLRDALIQKLGAT